MPKITLFILFTFIFSCLSSVQGASNRGFKWLVIQNKQGTDINLLYKESHALVIGVSDYMTNGWPDLPGVKTDIKQVSEALEDNGFHVVKITDPNSRQLADAFSDFISKYGGKKENRLLFYFAGHGYTAEQEWGERLGYIVPTDAPNPHRDLSGFQRKALPMGRIEEYAKSIHAKHGLFLFDSCFSGSLFAMTRAIPENINYKTAQPVRQFITAGEDDEQVPDISIFRQQFIAALKGEGDQDKDGYLTGSELGEFLQKQVINYSKNAQHPQYGKIRNPHLDKGDFVFKVKKTKPILLAGAGTGIADSQENNFWNSINKTDIDELKAYLSEYPRGHYARLAKIRLKKLQKPKIPAPIPIKAKTALLTL